MQKDKDQEALQASIKVSLPLIVFYFIHGIGCSDYLIQCSMNHWHGSDFTTNPFFATVRMNQVGHMHTVFFPSTAHHPAWVF